MKTSRTKEYLWRLRESENRGRRNMMRRRTMTRKMRKKRMKMSTKKRKILIMMIKCTYSSKYRTLEILSLHRQ